LQKILANLKIDAKEMKYVVLPVYGERRLSFYLAMEEYLARHCNEPDLFFMWQVQPSVIFGRNQLVENEVNLAYCREHGIQVYRRKSGGGCVYADQDNLMLSYITSEDNVNIAFNNFMNMLVLVLRQLDIEATCTVHNDVMIGDKKVSGTASYHLPGRSIVHGTLLYDTNMQHMLSSITPDPAKLHSKGIQSVRQRITLLKDYVSLSLDEVKSHIRTTLCCGELMLTESDVESVSQLEQAYLQQDFINIIS